MVHAFGVNAFHSGLNFESTDRLKANAATYIYSDLCMALDSGCDQIVSLAHNRRCCFQCMYRDHLSKCGFLV